MEIYVERMRMEYLNADCVAGKPRVASRETSVNAHKKQTGGVDQYAKVVGYIEPMEPDPETGKDVAFENVVIGGCTNFIPAIEKVTLPLLNLKQSFDAFQLLWSFEKDALFGNVIFGCHFSRMMPFSLSDLQPSELFVRHSR